MVTENIYYTYVKRKLKKMCIRDSAYAAPVEAPIRNSIMLTDFSRFNICLLYTSFLSGYIFNPESSGVCISTGTKCVGEIRYLITEYLKIAILIL